MKFWKKTQGAVSIFLVIILVPMMTVSALFVDASKIKLARSVAESAGDLALNTALTDYDTMLKDMYGLFATAQDTDELFAKLEDYYRTCITSSGVSQEDANSYVDQIMSQLGMVDSKNDTADILNMELVDFSATKRTDASLANATILENQIVQFMKYRAPINTGLSFLSSLQSFSTLGKQTELVDNRKEYYEAQETVMENAQEAWKAINNYNKSGFITSDSYFPDMESRFASYEGTYQSIAKKIIMDLYDTQSYGSFNPYLYSIADVTIDVNGDNKTIPVFYTNKDKTAKKKMYSEYTTYSDSNKATSSNIKTALNNYYTAYNAVKTAQSELMEYGGNTYGLQYLVQTNRRALYNTWVTSMVKLYEKYSELRHAVTYAGDNDSGTSVMTTSEKMCGESAAQPYSYYYEKFMRDFDEVVDAFNSKLPNYNSTLQNYANNSSTDKSPTEQQITALYSEITSYRTTISDAKDSLEKATQYLGYVLDGVKSGGTLEQKANTWKSTASSSELKNTSLAKQDLAEIDSLSTYLNADDVQKLITRLNNIKTHLSEMLNEIDSYTFFGTKIVEISDYTTFTNILKNSIGDSSLKTVPTDKTALTNQVNSWCNGKFVVGQKVDTSWRNQSGTQVILTVDKPNFYSYLYTHFNTGEVSTNTTEKPADSDGNGKDFYKNIKDKSSSSATNSASGTDSGNTSTSNEINAQSNLPSKNAGNNSETASAKVSTGESATKDTSSSLSSMFSELSKAALNMGTDLRDKLYVADYILSMFSYDTIEKEFTVNNPGKELNIQTLTLNPINAENNFAYGKEVEYIIYGGSNASNLTKAYGSIYGIRFGFNVIYAFMDSSIRDTAFAIATPISAATLGVIPVPLIQAAIIIGIACCESALDLVDLRNGEEVPLFKNNSTWKCSIKGLISEVKSEVGSALKEVGEAAIDVGVSELNNLLDMTDEELEKFISGGTDEVISYVENSYDTLITRHANTAIQKLTTMCTNAIEENMINPGTDMAAYVSKGLDSWLAEEASKTDTTNDIGYIVKAEAVNIIKQKYIQYVLDELSKNADSAQSTIAATANQITTIIDRIRTVITDSIMNSSHKVIDYKNQMKDKIEQSMSGGADSLKTTLNEQIDGVFGSGNSGSSDNTGISSLLSFSYSDYLRLFLMIGLYTNEGGIMLRTADVIQVNMAKKTGNNKYLLSNSSVYVEVAATIQVKPTLLALPLFADVEGNPKTNSKWYTVKYHDIKGY